ncbi:hypothetical protein ACHAPM_003716 [Fusarium culmorum]
MSPSQGESSQSLHPIQEVPLHRLPPEVRDMIWLLTLPSHRTFEVEAITREDNKSDIHLFRFEYPPPSPVALRVCREFRGAALRKGFLFSTTKGPSVWFRPETDTLYFRDFRGLRDAMNKTTHIEIPGWEQVLHLGFGYSNFVEYLLDMKDLVGFRDIFAHMPDLKTCSYIELRRETRSGEVILTIDFPLPFSRSKLGN